ncbi:hypothetical protein [Streptomyces luteolifulvus]|uniref:hypothetical protein n=1 Tax=Streptomyces luteolifulvus TaxID=2615112 RepID=UPI0038B67CE4
MRLPRPNLLGADLSRANLSRADSFRADRRDGPGRLPRTRCAHVPLPSPRPACGSIVPPQVAAM